eukprot:jgi/Mesvir1/13031/Mv06024-RA.1
MCVLHVLSHTVGSVQQNAACPNGINALLERLSGRGKAPRTAAIFQIPEGTPVITTLRKSPTHSECYSLPGCQDSAKPAEPYVRVSACVKIEAKVAECVYNLVKQPWQIQLTNGFYVHFHEPTRGLLHHATVKDLDADVGDSSRSLSFMSLQPGATSLNPLLTTASQYADGHYAYNTATIPLMAEFVKMCISAALLVVEIRQNPGKVQISRDVRSLLHFPLPSIMFATINNLQFAILYRMDPTSAQVLGNLKIAFTAVFFRWLLGVRLSQLRWLSLCLLGLASTMTQVSGYCDSDIAGLGYLAGMNQAESAAKSQLPPEAESPYDTALLASLDELPVSGTVADQRRLLWHGHHQPGHTHSLFQYSAYAYLLVMITVILSSIANVYTEYILKRRRQDSIHWQNVLLYSSGVVVNFVHLTARSEVDAISSSLHGESPWAWRDLFRGYDVVTVLVLLNMAVMGVLTSWLMKYADNIIKIFATSGGMFLTMIASAIFFGDQHNLQMLFGIIVASVSVYLYNYVLDTPANLQVVTVDTNSEKSQQPSS